MQPKSEVLFVATYDSGHEEWLWIEAHVICGADHVAGAIAKQRQQQGMLPEGNIQIVRRADHSVARRDEPAR